MLKHYRGGLWMDLYKKPILERPVEELDAPAKLVVPLLQYRGVPAVPCVKKGDHVRMGQPIGTEPMGAGAAETACTVHSPVSGTVYDMVEYRHPQVGETLAAVIQNDGDDAPYEYKPPQTDPAKMGPDEIMARLHRMGLAAGAGPQLPLWRRMERMAGAGVKNLVVNAVETEPYLCSAEKLMEENPEQLAQGLFALMKCAGCKAAVLAVSDDYGSEPEDVLKVASLMGLNLRLARVPRKYPSGNERFLFRLLTGEALPAGVGPLERQYGFVSVEDCIDTARAVHDCRPQITRVITAAGSALSNPQVLEVRIGTSIHDVLEHCGLGFEPERVVLGGVMRGTAVDDMRLPVIKATRAVLAVKAAKRKQRPALCINCGKCVKVCPQRLFPNFIALNAVNFNTAACEKLDIMSCIECGSCSYICPGRMPIVELIKKMKKACAAVEA